MTRETKIGLLVGLAFIIVIGILLSDHVTSSAEPPQAMLTKVAPNVRGSVTVPAGTNPPANATQVTAPAVSPATPVPTQREVTPRPQVVQIQVNGPGNVTPPARTPDTGPVQEPPPPTDRAAQDPAAAPRPTQTASLPLAPEAPPSAAAGQPSLRDLARAHQEDIVPVAPGRTTAVTTSPPVATTTGLREYKAQQGDTVSRMAGRFLGANTRANREAIINANPSLKDDPDRIVTGRTYIIPAAPAGAVGSAPTPSATGRPASVATSGTTAPGATASASSDTSTYTTVEGDSLWGIAKAQLGSGKYWMAIRDLNKDLLHGSDQIPAGMVLRLPARQVASAH